MPTQIIDGFNLNANKPIDSRMVTNGLPSRNAIQYKYEGLRVYDIVDKTGYVWINGAWATDGGTGGGGGGGGGTINTVGIPDYIAKFDTSGLTQSVIRETKIGQNGFVGIGVASALGKYRLEVGGTVYATSFAGPANSINGTMIETASLDPNKIVPRPNDGNTYLLRCVNGANQWTLDAGSAAIDITNDTDDTIGYLTFTDFATGDTGKNKTLKVSLVDSDTGLAVKPSTGQILGSVGSDPAYAFLGQTTTGLYRDNSEIGLKLTGDKVLSSDGTTVKLFSGSTSTFEISTAAAAINSNTTITGTLGVSGNTTLDGTLVVNGSSTTVSTQLNVNGNAFISGGTLAVFGTADSVTFLTAANNPTSPPNRIANGTGTGLYVVSKGEGVRLDTIAGNKMNLITFFKEGLGITKAAGGDVPHAISTGRSGWLGYGSSTQDYNGFYLYNESAGDMEFFTKGAGTSMATFNFVSGNPIAQFRIYSNAAAASGKYIEFYNNLGDTGPSIKGNDDVVNFGDSENGLQKIVAESLQTQGIRDLSANKVIDVTTNTVKLKGGGNTHLASVSNGLQHVAQRPSVRWTTSITSTSVRWCSDTSGNTTSGFTWPATSVPYDRILYIYTGGNGSLDVKVWLQVSNEYDASERINVGRCPNYSGIGGIIIPAYKKYAISVEAGVASSGTMTTTIYAFGNTDFWD